VVPPVAPKDWPERAKEVFEEYARQRLQKHARGRDHLLRLLKFLRFQVQHGASFRDFSVLDNYLKHFTQRRNRGHLIDIRAWMSFLYQRKELLLPVHEDYPVGHLPRYSRRLPLSHEQVLQVMSAVVGDSPPELRDRAWLEVAYGSALRRSELQALDLPDLDLNEGWVFLKNTKNRQQRKVPLTQWAVHCLSRYLEEGRPHLTSPLSSKALWLNHFGGRMDPGRLSYRLIHNYEIRKKLDFHFVPHQLRHTAATQMLLAGAGIRAVQELLGHKDLASTAHYTHLSPGHLRDMHQRFHPRNLMAAGLFEEIENP